MQFTQPCEPPSHNSPCSHMCFTKSRYWHQELALDTLTKVCLHLSLTKQELYWSESHYCTRLPTSFMPHQKSLIQCYLSVQQHYDSKQCLVTVLLCSDRQRKQEHSLECTCNTSAPLTSVLGHSGCCRHFSRGRHANGSQKVFFRNSAQRHRLS